MDVGRIFSGGGTSGFFQTFFWGGAKVVKFVFYHPKLRKHPFLLKFQIPVLLPTPVLVCGKNLCHTIKNWYNFKRFNTILNSEILLNLPTQNQILGRYISIKFLFLHWQH